jgi:ankyrin repeat protein
MKQLGAQINIRNVKRELEKLPKTLDETYSVAMTRIKAQDETHSQLAMRTLLWVQHTFRPLKLAEIRHAVATEAGDDEMDEDALEDATSLVSFTAGLLVLDGTGTVVSLAHLSVGDYLARAKEDWFSDCDQRMTETCLTYMSFKSFASGSTGDDESFKVRLTRYPFFDYASRFWGMHARKSPEAAVKTSITTFLDHDANVASSVQALQVSHELVRGLYSRLAMHNFTILMYAAYHGLKIVVEGLCANNDNIEAADDAGMTALHYAARNGYLDVVQLLMEHGANELRTDLGGQAVFYHAAAEGQSNVVDFLLKRSAAQNTDSDGAKKLVDAREKTQDRTALVDAAALGQIDVMNLLLDAGADVNARTNTGNTVLMVAAYNSQEAAVRLLISRGADVTLKDENGFTALRNESLWGPHTMLSFMLEHGADPDVADNGGITPLSQARSSRLTEVVKLFENFKLSKPAELR